MICRNVSLILLIILIEVESGSMNCANCHCKVISLYFNGSLLLFLLKYLKAELEIKKGGVATFYWENG